MGQGGFGGLVRALRLVILGMFASWAGLLTLAVLSLVFPHVYTLPIVLASWLLAIVFWLFVRRW